MLVFTCMSEFYHPLVEKKVNCIHQRLQEEVVSGSKEGSDKEQAKKKKEV